MDIEDTEGPHNRFYISNSDKHYAVHSDAQRGHFTGLVLQTSDVIGAEDSLEIFASTNTLIVKRVKLITDTIV